MSKMTVEEYNKKYANFIALYNNGWGQRKLADYFNVHKRTISDWIRKGKKLGVIKNINLIERVKKQTKLQDEKNLVNQLLKEKARTELIIDAVKEAIVPADYNQYKYIFRFSKGKEIEEACLVLSDIHIGKKTKTYDSSIFLQRLNMIVNAINKIINILNSGGYKIKKLNIMFAGDVVDGEGIYPTQSYHVDQSVLKQVFQVGLPAFSKAIIDLLQIFEEIECFCVPGNHGRTGKFAAETSNWDRVFYEAMKTATKNYRNIKWNISYEWDLQFKIYSWVFELIHGHQIRMYLHTPHYGVTARGMRWQGSKGHFDYLVMGHFHNTAMCDFNDFEYLMNGTFSSDDEFADEKLGLLGSLKQLFFGVHPRKGITWRYKLCLK